MPIVKLKLVLAHAWIFRRFQLTLCSQLRLCDQLLPQLDVLPHALANRHPELSTQCLSAPTGWGTWCCEVLLAA